MVKKVERLLAHRPAVRLEVNGAAELAHVEVVFAALDDEEQVTSGWVWISKWRARHSGNAFIRFSASYPLTSFAFPISSFSARNDLCCSCNLARYCCQACASPNC